MLNKADFCFVEAILYARAWEPATLRYYAEAPEFSFPIFNIFLVFLINHTFAKKLIRATTEFAFQP